MNENKICNTGKYLIGRKLVSDFTKLCNQIPTIFFLMAEIKGEDLICMLLHKNWINTVPNNSSSCIFIYKSVY